MDKSTAQRIVKDTFKTAFDRDRFHNFVNELTNGFDKTNKQTMQIPDAFKPHVASCQRIGTYESPEHELADVLIVHLTESYKLERTRTALRDFVAHKLKRGDGEDNAYKEAALVAFVAPDAKSWRFSFVRMEYETKRDPKTGRIKPEERLTPARRFSYLVGAEEECHTAQARFLDLLKDTTTKPSLAKIEEAFSVESVTKEFFNQYAGLFQRTHAALEAIIATDEVVKADFQAKGVSSVDFAKKLLGQIVFLHFIQKKGWLGVPKGGKWGDGPKNFMRQLADRSLADGKCLFNEVLEPLFYDTLATDRGHEAWCKPFSCRIPFLNGGLFEPISGYDWQSTSLAFSNDLFTNSDTTKEGDTGTGILDVFDRYNFTVNEAEPLEKEVAIDPEMLGKVFENLIEENRRKGLGAYYTPREIVHYMCQESLINYLDTTLNPESSVVPRADIEALIREGEMAAHYEADRTQKERWIPRRLPKTVEKHARTLDDALKSITVCDPAIGSGAFPVGMMTEIVRARIALTPYFNDITDRTPYLFKRHAIHHSIYGADIDSGAVEIAKLRLWLSLVVDEDDVSQVKPLPNLDYKIVGGDSLMGVKQDLSSLPAFRRLEQLKPLYFDETIPRKKKEYKVEIERLISQLTRNKEVFDFHIYFSEIFHFKRGFDVVIANPPYIGERGHKELFRKTKDGLLGEFYNGKMDYFYFFFHLALNLACPNGEIAFITTNYYLTATGAKKLRADFKRRSMIRSLLNFNELRIFETAQGQHNIVSLLSNRRGEDVVHTCVTNRLGQATPDILSSILRGTDERTHYYEVGQPELYDGVENYMRPSREQIITSGESISINTILDKMVAKGEALGRIATVNQGIVTGCDYLSLRNRSILPLSADVCHGDGVFVLDLETPRDKRIIDGFSAAEKRLLRRFYKNSDIGSYSSSTETSKRILYVGRDIESLSEYPKVLAHLSKFKAVLSTRREVENGVIQFFQVQWPRNEDLFSGEKVIVPYRSEVNSFTYNKAEWFCASDCFVITQKLPSFELRYLLALLNSKLYFQWLFHRGKRKGRMMELISKPLSEIPIKRLDAAGQKVFIDLADRILAAKKKNPNADTGELEHIIDTKVFDLYGLTEAERALVMAPAN
jgi:type I restriction-modification system DNA methylase subunit